MEKANVATRAEGAERPFAPHAALGREPQLAEHGVGVGAVRAAADEWRTEWVFPQLDLVARLATVTVVFTLVIYALVSGTSVGALFMAFPSVLASGLSGFYFAIFLVAAELAWLWRRGPADAWRLVGIRPL